MLQQQQQQQHQQQNQVSHQLIPANLQQIQQQMLHRVQQAAAMGKPMQVGTQLMSNGAIGIVTANNNVQVSFPGLMNRNGQQLITQHRLQGLRLPTPGQDHSGAPQQQQTQPQQPNQGPRMILQQQLQQQSQQQINRMAMGGAPQAQQAQINQPPPPPYPGPPPPYPGNAQTSSCNQEQPLLLEDLLEQEKREQERQQITSTIANVQSNTQLNQGIIDDQNYPRVTNDIFSGSPQTTNAQGTLPSPQTPQPQQQQQQQHVLQGPPPPGVKTQFLPRALGHAQWRPTTPTPQQQHVSPGLGASVVTDAAGIRRDGNGAIQLFTANLQPPPPLPPENVVTEQDRQIQMNYEQWLTQQNNALTEQLKYYETEVTKLRKVKKSLNSKQRQMRKLGSELCESDARDLAKITSEQNIVQKQLESARKQSRQHSLVIQDYKGKQMSKMQNQIISPLGQLPGSSPAHIAPQSPITSPSPGSQQILQSTGQSPLNSQMVQSHQSPMHSPSPLMPSQSPGPTSVNSIMQSPSNQQSSMSPYNTMQPSPRIGTPLSQSAADECPFSPNNPGPSQSPSMPGRLTSPQHRMGAPNMQGNRIVTSPGVGYQQQQNIMQPNQILPQQQQQNRFVRPQVMTMQSDVIVRPRIVFSQQQQQQMMRQTSAGYNSPLGSPQPTIGQVAGQGQGQHSVEHMHSQRTMQLVQQRHLIQRQQMLQQHQQQQQQQNQYQKQGNLQQQQQQQQPASPMMNQQGVNPPSPMARGAMGQFSAAAAGGNNQPMQSPIMRRPPSTGGVTANSPVGSDRSQSVENSPRHIYIQQQHGDGGGNSMDGSGGGGGGGGGMNNPIPLPVSFGRFGYIKLGLRGGTPMWGYGSKRMPAPSSGPAQNSPSSTAASTSQGARKETHLNRISILKKKKLPALPHDVIVKTKGGSLTSAVEYGDMEDSSNTPPESPLHVRSGESQAKPVIGSQNPTSSASGERRKAQEEIVVIDSSPDEKQRIMDYDDDNDKAVVATEVSLSSAAQSVPDTDDISVIESLAPTEFDAIVSSPLESEVTEEYVLFAPDMVVDYADSDDSMKQASMQHLTKTAISDEDKTLDLIASPSDSFPQGDDSDDEANKGKGDSSEQFTEDHFTTGEEDMMSMGSEIVIIGSDVKSPEEQMATDTIDGVLQQTSSAAKETKERTSDQTTTEKGASQLVEKGVGITLIATSSSSPSPSSTAKKVSPILTYSSCLPVVTSTLIATRPNNPISSAPMTAVSVHKKLMKDVTQTTAIVSIGNTTISVPVLKNVPLSHNKSPTVGDGQGGATQTQTKGKIFARSPISVKLPKTVVTMSGHKILSPASIVTISSLNLGQGTSGNKVTATQIAPATVTSQSMSEKMLERFTTKSSSPSLVYSKLSSLTVNQDASLPNKIFEDESVSPDSSVEHDDPDLHHLSIKVDFQCDTENPKEDSAATPDEAAKEAKKEKEQQQSENGEQPKESSGNDQAKEDNEERKEGKEVKLNDLQKTDTKQKQNVIPYHVIVKSRDSARSPKLSTGNQRNSTSNMPQLSPLSQPTEMATNMQNVSQEVRSILSSISSSGGPSVATISIKSGGGDSTGTSQDASQSSSDAGTDSRTSHGGTESATSSSATFEKVEIIKTDSVTPMPNKLVTSDRSSPVLTNPISGGSILVVKQLLASNQVTTSPKSQLATKSSGNSPISQSPATQSVIIAQSQQIMPNLTKIQSEAGVVSILSNQLTGQHPRIINYSDLQYSSTQPPALVMTSRQGIIQGTVVPITTSTSTSGASTGSSIQFSGSILGATLSQPSFKATTQSQIGSTLLHTQLTSAAFRRSKSTDEQPAGTPALIHGTKRHSVELANVVKSEPMDTTEETATTSGVTTATSSIATPPKATDSLGSGCKFSTMSVPQAKSEDSQNVLLKQLLQNSGSTSTPSPTPPAIASRTVPGLRAPSLGLVSSLEAQLARPALPPVPSNASQILPASQTTNSPTSVAALTTSASCSEVSVTKSTVRTHIFMQRETSFVSKPPQSPSQQQQQQQQQELPQSGVISTSAQRTTSGCLCQLIQPFIPLEPPPPYPSLSSSLDAIAPPNVVINKDTPLPVQSPVLGQGYIKQSSSPPATVATAAATAGPPSLAVIDVKKEIMDDPSVGGVVTEKSAGQKALESVVGAAVTIPKSEIVDPTLEQRADGNAAKTAQETALEMKKRKRREYQKSRRQMQILSKEAMNSGSKKRPRKFSKIEEDYDTFIDNLMVQLRQLPHMQILEPTLCRNFGVGPVYGSGDLSKMGPMKEYSIAQGELTGEYGCAEIPNVADFYIQVPLGLRLRPMRRIRLHQRIYGFYDQEFSPMTFDTEEDTRCKYDATMKERDNETPDTVISSSSPECSIWEPLQLYPGLRLINEDDEDDQEHVYRSMSPPIPLIAPIPIRLKPGMQAPFNLLNQLDVCNKENEGMKDMFGVKSHFGSPTPLKDSSNVTVTLTLTSSAAEDIMGVLRNLANILHIPAPTAYQIVERTTTPPSQKLGLYRTKGKDGKEGAPIDIQTILNGAAKFCRHCDVVILNSMIRAKASEFPLLTINNTTELLNDDLYFCSRACYKQFQWRPTSILEENRQEVGAKTDAAGSDDKTVKVSEKNFTDVIMTTSTTCDLNEDDLKMEVDLEEQDGGKEASQSGSEQCNELVEVKQEQMEEGSTTEEDRKAKYKGVRYKMFTNNCFVLTVGKYKKPTEKEITETLFRMNITVTASKQPEDTRKCIFCHQVGDGVADGPSRLLNFDVDKWVHLNCALWSDGVYETVNGALMNLENALQASLVQACIVCGNLGSTIKCFKTRCTNVYHLNCALKDNCVFYKNKTTMCSSHAPKTEKDNELTTLSVQRRVYVERDEGRQVASVMHHSELSNLMRVGSLIFLNVGQLLPHQLIAFHTPNYIYPIGYKIIRFYWSMRQPNRRCRYICSIADVSGRPEFRVLVQEPQKDDIELRDFSPRAVWQRILEPLAQMRKENQLIQVFPKYITGEDLFGLTEPAVVRILESLPGIETLTDYRFKYGRNPLLELPLAINPSGAARTEPKLKQSVGWKKPHTQRTGSTSQRPTFVPTTSIAGEVACPYSKQFVHSKSSQYKKMKQEWRNNVYLARSKIQGLGLYAARDLEKHTM
uniref:PHD-type domain-containing protein n=1 Tax=Lutzomyia longipalpis TaxID=7200 RepID=A0A1B0CW28_LUTLO